MTDKERLNWLGKTYGAGLISDDAGRWAVTVSGMQNVPDPDKASDISTLFFVEAQEWKGSIRKAIDFAIKTEKAEGKEASRG